VQSIAKGEKLKEEMGEILDEIDSVLEENAEEYVNQLLRPEGRGVSDTSSDLPVGGGRPDQSCRFRKSRHSLAGGGARGPDE
jgi:ubiquitin-like protein Pup